MDPHLVEDTIFAFGTTPLPTQIPTQTLGTPTVHHLATVMAAPSPDHSWQEVAILNPMKLKCFMKVLEAKKFLFTENRDRVILYIQVSSFLVFGESLQIDQSKLVIKVNSWINCEEYYKNRQ